MKGRAVKEDVVLSQDYACVKAEIFPQDADLQTALYQMEVKILLPHY